MRLRAGVRADGVPAADGRGRQADPQTIAADAAVRLGRVCADWPRNRFAALIADVVQFRERWAAWDRGRAPTGDSPA